MIHWFRAKFFQQYRLFFCYHQASKIIVYAWVNIEATLRAYDSKTDAYQVFPACCKTAIHRMIDLLLTLKIHRLQ